jgi:hypothetical protein
LSADADHPAIAQLRARLDEEERAYAEVLAAVDALAAFALPAEADPETREKLARLNALWSAPEQPAGGGLGRALRRWVWDTLAPALDRQTEFNATLVQILNARLDAADRLHSALRDLAGALVRYTQRVQPLVDANARLASALATTRSELVLESFGRQLESHARRLDEMAALGRKVEAIAAALEARRQPSPRP